MSGYDSESGSSGYLYVARPQRPPGVPGVSQLGSRHPHPPSDTWYSGVASSSPPHSGPFSPLLASPAVPTSTPAPASAMPYAGGLVPPLHVPQHVPASARAAIASGASLLPPPTEPPPPPPSTVTSEPRPFPHDTAMISPGWPLYSNTCAISPRPGGRREESLLSSTVTSTSRCARVHRVCARMLTGVFVCVAVCGVCLVVADSLLRYRWSARVHGLLSIGVLMLFVATVMLFVLCRRTVALVSSPGIAGGSGAHCTTSAHRLMLASDGSAAIGHSAKHSFSRSPLVCSSGLSAEQIPLTRVCVDEFASGESPAAGGGVMVGNGVTGGVYMRAADGVLVCSNTLPRRLATASAPTATHTSAQSPHHTPLLRHNCIQEEQHHEPVYQESEYSHPWDHLADRRISGDNRVVSSVRRAHNHDYANAPGDRG